MVAVGPRSLVSTIKGKTLYIVAINPLVKRTKTNIEYVVRRGYDFFPYNSIRVTIVAALLEDSTNAIRAR